MQSNQEEIKENMNNLQERIKTIQSTQEKMSETMNKLQKSQKENEQKWIRLEGRSL